MTCERPVLLTAQEVADALNVTLACVRRWLLLRKISHLPQQSEVLPLHRWKLTGSAHLLPPIYLAKKTLPAQALVLTLHGTIIRQVSRREEYRWWNSGP
jgi:hypothetical protein